MKKYIHHQDSYKCSEHIRRKTNLCQNAHDNRQEEKESEDTAFDKLLYIPTLGDVVRFTIVDEIFVARFECPNNSGDIFIRWLCCNRYFIDLIEGSTGWTS